MAIILAPVVAPLITAEGALYISAGVAGFLKAAWGTELTDSGVYTKDYEQETLELDLRDMEFQTDLKAYETEQKQTIQQKIDEYIANYIPPSQTIKQENITKDIRTEKGLVDSMKSSAIASIEQQKILNNNLTTLNATLTSMFQAKNAEIVNQNKTIALLSEHLLALNKSMATLATLPKVTAEVNTSPKISNTVKMTPKFDVTMQNTIDTSALTTATATLATGVENQIATNAKIVEKLDKEIEHYDFLAKGVDTLKDSKGNIIKPREVEAKNNAEHHIDKESFNKFDSSVLIDSLDEIDKDFDSDVETIKNLFSSILVLDKDKFKSELNQNIFKVAP